MGVPELQYRRPWLVGISSLTYILAPVVAALALSRLHGLSLGVLLRAPLETISPGPAILLFLAPTVGLGLFLQRRWGFILFSVHAVATLILASAGLPWSGPAAPLVGAGTFTVIVFVTYFLRRDQRLPFLSPHPRGWRQDRRFACRAEVRLDSERAEGTVTVVDISRAGVLLHCPGLELTLGDRTKMTVLTSGDGVELNGRVVRTAQEHAGVKFTSRLDRAPFRELLVALESGGSPENNN